jgi:hypothetical protein
MLDTSLKAKGQLELKLLDAYGNVKELRNVNNLIVTTGLAHITSRLYDESATKMTHMGIGTGTATAVAGDTSITSGSIPRVPFDTITRTTTTVANDTIQYVATFPANSAGLVYSGAITEAGIFNASTVGTMFCRTVFNVINKGTADSLVITWKIAMTSAP